MNTSKLMMYGNSFISYLNNTTQDLVRSVLKKEEKITLLEPISTIIFLGLLTFKQQGSKLSIFDHNIKVQEPSSTQGITRWTFGDTKHDLHNLYNPIRRFIEWEQDSLMEEILTEEQIKYFTTQAIQGLNNIKRTYSSISEMTKQILDLYIQMLENKTIIKNEDNEDEYDDPYSKVLNNISNNLWKPDEISIINEHFKLCYKNKMNFHKLNGNLNSIECILNSNNNIFKREIIKHIS